MLIITRAKTEEVWTFYLLLNQKNSYSARELEWQIDSMPSTAQYPNKTVKTLIYSI
ncbi:MAG: hypothetical protein FWH37_03115 [Candidatus Bathyarchaeota archaeon]|nr:hypothetical protein [Candidatus Termiticorpusculum sp.]